MNKKNIMAALGILLLIVVGAARIFRRSMMHHRDSAQTPAQRIAPAVHIQGLDDHTLQAGTPKTFQLVTEGLPCNALRITARGVSVRLLGECTCEVSGAKAGEGFLRVYGAGKALIDSFPLTVR